MSQASGSSLNCELATDVSTGSGGRGKTARGFPVGRRRLSFAARGGGERLPGSGRPERLFAVWDGISAHGRRRKALAVACARGMGKGKGWERGGAELGGGADLVPATLVEGADRGVELFDRDSHRRRDEPWGESSPGRGISGTSGDADDEGEGVCGWRGDAARAKDKAVGRGESFPVLVSTFYLSSYEKCTRRSTHKMIRAHAASCFTRSAHATPLIRYAEHMLPLTLREVHMLLCSQDEWSTCCL